MMAKDKGIKYFRVMSKQELLTVLQHPEKAVSIGQIARARWMKTGPKIPVSPKDAIATLTAELEKKSTAELMRMAQAKHILNFRVMRKKELILVLSDPTQYDKIQIAVKARLRAARGLPGKKPGTTQADDLKLVNIAERKRIAIEKIESNATSYDDVISSDQFRKTTGKWLQRYDLETLEAAANKNLLLELYELESDVPWRGGHSGFSGMYWRGRKRLALIRYKRGYKVATFDHEMGHFIEDQVSAYLRCRDTCDSDMLDQRKLVTVSRLGRGVDWNEKWKWVINGGNKVVSDYSLYDSGEHWAEAIKYYMTGEKRAQKLKTVSPVLYEKIKKAIFHGKEF